MSPPRLHAHPHGLPHRDPDGESYGASDSNPPRIVAARHPLLGQRGPNIQAQWRWFHGDQARALRNQQISSNQTIATATAVGITLWGLGGMTGEGLTLLGATISTCAIGWRSRHTLTRMSVGATLLIASVLLACISSLWAPGKLVSGAPWSSLHILFFPIAVIAIRGISHRAKSRIALLLIITATLSALLALQQSLMVLDYGEWLSRYRHTYRMEELSPTGFYRAGGLHFHRLKFAHTLVFLGIALMPMVLSYAHTLRRRLGVMALALLLVAALTLSHTQASWLGILAALLLFPLAQRCGQVGRWRLIGLSLLGSFIVPLILLLTANFPIDRQIAWGTALQIFINNPILGVGFGGYPEAALALNGGVHAVFQLIHVDAHSLLLQVFAERGLAGVVLLSFAAWRYKKLLGTITASQVALIGSGCAIGMVHNFAFHPVVFISFALALAWESKKRYT